MRNRTLEMIFDNLIKNIYNKIRENLNKKRRSHERKITVLAR